MDDKLAADEARRSVQHEAVKAQVEAGEFRELVASGKLAWSDIRELGEFVTGKAKGRTSPSELPAQLSRLVSLPRSAV